MNKFEKMLSADSSTTLGKRANILSESTISEVENFINNLKAEKRALASRMLDLTDLAPDNTYSLRPGGKDFNATKWMSELHKTRMDIALKQIELDEAQAIHDEWFSEVETKTKNN